MYFLFSNSNRSRAVANVNEVNGESNVIITGVRHYDWHTNWIFHFYGKQCVLPTFRTWAAAIPWQMSRSMPVVVHPSRYKRYDITNLCQHLTCLTRLLQQTRRFTSSVLPFGLCCIAHTVNSYKIAQPSRGVSGFINTLCFARVDYY